VDSGSLTPTPRCVHPLLLLFCAWDLCRITHPSHLILLPPFPVVDTRTQADWVGVERRVLDATRVRLFWLRAVISCTRHPFVAAFNKPLADDARRPTRVVVVVARTLTDDACRPTRVVVLIARTLADDACRPTRVVVLVARTQAQICLDPSPMVFSLASIVNYHERKMNLLHRLG